MLSRAARNAYSWWWASHIRTKQSKWLDQNLLDMEEKVEYILKIITEDGDSFRVRAEQYYEKRPELVNFVQDTFRGYRALAERYDHLSKDLQSANRTIAMVFPERVHMSFDNEEEHEDFASSFDEYENMIPANAHIPLPPKQKTLPKMESVVQSMLKKKSKMRTKMMSKNGLLKIGVDKNASKVSKISGLSIDEANDEIHKLQKDILEFQTEKEFVKSSYENALSKYREIENNINEMHTKISNLQHEFAVGEAMGDQDAQTLMSTSALHTCKETLHRLKHKQKRFKTEAVVEHNRVNEIRKKFEALIARDCNDIDSKKLEQTSKHVKDKKEKTEDEDLKSCEENGALVQQEHLHGPNRGKAEGIDCVGLVKIQETRKFDQKDSEYIEDKKTMTKDETHRTIEEITISEVADKIEQLVGKVITLETDLASQTAIVMRLRFEIDELHEHVQSLEQENSNHVDESNNKNIKIKKLEEELERIQMLDKKIEEQNVQMENSLDKASVRLDKLSNDLLIAKPDDQNSQEDDVIFKPEEKEPRKIWRLEEKEKENQRKDSDDLEAFVKEPNEKDEGDHHLKFTKSKVIREDQDVHCNGEEDKPNWNLILTHGIEDRERMLLEEYTSTLKTFKEIKQKLNESEKKNRVTSFKSAVQMKMLRSSNDSKDDEIRSLHEKLKKLEAKIDFQVKKGLERKELDTITKNGLFMKGCDMIDKGTQDWIPGGTESEFEVDEATEVELTKASNAIDEGTNRITELVENAHFELQKAKDLINVGTEERKEPGETIECESMKSTDLVDEGRQRSKELNETTDFELKKVSNLVDERKHRSKELDETTDFDQKKAPNSLDEEVHKIKQVDKITNHELKKTPDLICKGTLRRNECVDGVDEAHESLEIEEEIRAEIEDLRKENLELWLRFSTSYHQINRFQDSFHDLLQEIKQVKEKTPEHGGGKQRHHNHQAAYAFDIRPLYRHLRDMQTEITLWLEKSGILEDDLQHRLTSLSDIQNELSDLTNDVLKSKTTTTNIPRNNYQAVQFQGEVLNMEQENIKVIKELREASERVRILQFDIEKTLSKLDEQLGEINKSHSRSRVAFKSIIFGSKLRKKHKHSLFTCMSPSLQRQYSNFQELPQPREDSS
ncbi:hypothetical protein SSX86_024784 [Deinandra increscens subsp. villosa]|uniref:NAB domain-containing protein n=1 Tax=Deinandra increscens subsp. villosa TaxID=3103831 RepID=A0AAP0CC55_9ASTR